MGQGVLVGPGSFLASSGYSGGFREPGVVRGLVDLGFPVEYRHPIGFRGPFWLVQVPLCVKGTWWGSGVPVGYRCLVGFWGPSHLGYSWLVKAFCCIQGSPLVQGP